MKRTLAAFLAAFSLALTLAGTAGAATLNDLRVLGYNVGEATQCETPTHTWLTVWSVSGFGMSTYLSECDPDYQATLDSIANPVAHCNRVWQYTYPAQVGPEMSIERLGWTVTGDRCADTFVVTNPNDQTVRYTGPGTGLVDLSTTIGAPPVPAPPPPVVVPPAPPAPPVVAPPVAPPAAPAPAPAPTPQAPAAPNPPPEPQPAPVGATPPPVAAAVAVPAVPAVSAPVYVTVNMGITSQQLERRISVAVAKALRAERARVAKVAAKRRAVLRRRALYRGR